MLKGVVQAYSGCYSSCCRIIKIFTVILQQRRLRMAEKKLINKKCFE